MSGAVPGAASSTPAPATAPTNPGPALVVRRLWPAGLAVGVSAAFWGIDAATAGALLPLLPLVYVALVVVGRRAASWPLLLLGTAGFVVLQTQSTIDPVLALAVAAVWLVAAGCRSAPRRELVLQTCAMAAVVALVLAADAVPPDAARVVLAVGWGAHGAWDLWHLRRDAVASRSYAQWCGVLDVLVAVQLLMG